MVKQLAFGFDENPVEILPMFLALGFEGESAQPIEQCAEHVRKTYDITGPSRPFHVTLCEIAPRMSLPRMIETISEVAATMKAPSFSVAFDRVMKFGDAVVLTGDDGVAGLLAFRQALCFGLQKAGLGKWSAKGYTPHLTLLYDAQKLDARIAPVQWTVREFLLLRSLVGQTKHETLGQWTLGG